jgi:hypothetical protein
MTRHVALLVAWLASIPGCSVVTANNRQSVQATQAVSSGDPAAALAALEGHDDLPDRLDRAVILADMGRPAASNEEFDRALAMIQGYEGRAVVSAQDAGRNLSSLALNDKMLEYKGEGFEKVLIHVYKARNFVLLGDEEAARVEIRNANLRQDEERRHHREAIDEARAEAKGAVDAAKLDGEIDRQFVQQQAILARLDNVYQNPFATYLSGYVYEANGEPGEAFVDYKNAFQMTHSPLVGADVVRLAQKLKRKSEAKALGLDVPSGNPTSGGDTLVLLDNGFAPQRRQIKFPIPTTQTVLFAAVPISQPIASDLGESEIVDQRGNVLGRTEMLVDVEAMSVRNLRDRYPEILVRQVARVAAKGAAAHAAHEGAKSKKSGSNDRTAELLVDLATSVFNAVTEQADLRTWYALPRSMHVARVHTPQDASTVTLRLLSPGGQTLREVSAPIVSTKGGEKIVVARYVGGTVLTQAPASDALSMRR